MEDTNLQRKPLCLERFTVKGIPGVGTRERIMERRLDKDITFYRLSNNIVVVDTHKQHKYLEEEGIKIKKHTPWISLEGEEYVYERDIMLIETTRSKEYIGIFKEL